MPKTATPQWRRDQLVDSTLPDDDVIAALSDPSPAVRAAAIELVGERRLVEAYRTLDLAVDDADGGVRLAAVIALGRMGDPACVPLLRAHLDIDLERHGPRADSEFRRALRWSLAALGHHAASDPTWATWTPIDLDAWSREHGGGRRDTAVAVAALRARMRRGRDPFVVVYSGRRPSPLVIDELISSMDAPPSREPVDLCVVDDGDVPLFSALWRSWARDGLVTTTAPSSTFGDDRGWILVARRSALDITAPARVKRAWQRPSWWIAAVVVAVVVGTEALRLASTSRPPSPAERDWLAAAAGDGGDVATTLPGSTLWPTVVRPVLDVVGVGGVRYFSLVCTTLAIVCAAAATSRLFGRWAARTTAAALTVAVAGFGSLSAATPAPFASAFLAAALLGISIVEHHERKSWVLMTGVTSTIAVIAWYPAVVFVVVLTWFFALMRGRAGSLDSIAFRLIVAGGVLAWFLPTREVTLQFVRERRDDGGWLVVAGDTALVAAIGVGFALFVLLLVRSRVVRRRVIVLSTSALAIPLAALIADDPNDPGALVAGLVLVVPAVAGAIVYPLAAWRNGTTALPAPRVTPEILIVDPSTGRLDGRMIRYPNWQVRLAIPLVLVSATWYLPWAALNIEDRNWWLAVPFLLANAFMAASALLSLYNNRTRAMPIPLEVAAGHEPLVGVIVPTCGEPVHMVITTVRTVLDQDWPIDRLRVVVSDDAHSDDMERRVEELASAHPAGAVTYHRPPKRGDPARRGDSKSGNLNSAIGVLDEFGVDYVETRDADDMVGSREFLRATVAHMIDDPGVGFVQTIKRTRTSPGDPFNNNEPFFYRGTMLARNADNAIFPCGSGLVWRRTALAGIGDFPAWNLVEDLHSGVLGLRRGWRGLYVPIVGAVAQHSPEDVANAFKQRGTWALDTTRLFAFDRFRGMPWRARLHFVEQAIFYLQSFALLTLFLVPAIGLLFDRFPLLTDSTTYAVRFWGFALSIELALLALAADQPTGSLWRSRLSWIGMAPVYARAAVKALRFGPNRKPAYKVTRKTDEYQVYVKLVIVHWAILLSLVAGLAVAVVRDSVAVELDLGSVYWAVIGLVGLGAFLRLSWFGVDLHARARQRWASSALGRRIIGMSTTNRAAIQLDP